MVTPRKPVQFWRFGIDKWKAAKSEIIVETPVSLTVNGKVWLTFMCTPVHLEALAVGFLFNEGMIQSMDEVATAKVCEHGDNIDVWLNHGIEQPKSWRRTSGCTGGMTAIEVDDSQSVCCENGSTITPEQVSCLINSLCGAQELYRETGGVHTSALSNGECILVSTEDIGRHNTLDKIAGLCLINNIWPKQRILLTTGRISSEMLQKATRIGTFTVISLTSPSSLSIQMAERWGITLIGYARRNHFNVYAHAERIISPE